MKNHRYAQFLTATGERIGVDHQVYVATLRGAQKLAGECTPDELVRITFLTTTVLATRCDGEFRAALQRLDGRGVTDPTVHEVQAPTPQPTTLRHNTQRGWCKVHALLGRVHLEFAPWVNSRVATIHCRGALAMLECEVEDTTLLRDDVALVPIECTTVAERVVRNYLVEHGFSIQNAA